MVFQLVHRRFQPPQTVPCDPPPGLRRPQAESAASPGVVQTEFGLGDFAPDCLQAVAPARLRSEEEDWPEFSYRWFSLWKKADAGQFCILRKLPLFAANAAKTKPFSKVS
jgi:hypothetical protein